MIIDVDCCEIFVDEFAVSADRFISSIKRNIPNKVLSNKKLTVHISAT